jgi:hypothetical protein
MYVASGIYIAPTDILNQMSFPTTARKTAWLRYLI